MKKILFLFVFVLFASGLFAQSTARTAFSRTIRSGISYFEYTGVAADTVGTEQDSLFFEITTNRSCPINVAARIEVTQTGSTDDYEYKLQGKVFENDNWPQSDGLPISVDSLNAQTGDASLYHVDVEVDATQAASVTPFYRIWRVVIASDGDVAATTDKLTVDKIIFKIWDR